jgi:hypothetical protein
MNKIRLLQLTLMVALPACAGQAWAEGETASAAVLPAVKHAAAKVGHEARVVGKAVAHGAKKAGHLVKVEAHAAGQGLRHGGAAVGRDIKKVMASGRAS